MKRIQAAHRPRWAVIMLAAWSVAACDTSTTTPGDPRANAGPEAGGPALAPSATGIAIPSGAGSTAANIAGKVSSLAGDVREFAVRITASSTIVELPSDTLFAFDKADLTPQALQTLPKVADLIRRAGAGDIVIAGHTDALGSDDYNLALSKRRAEAVRNWFVKEQIAPADRFQIDAVGKARPIAPNAKADGSDNPAGRAQNRRVEIIIPRLDPEKG
jgi:outer membrane protein OmpA-like peptidoglycan-associated protein